MLRNLGSVRLYDEGMIDERNERPLTIALATIVLVWLLAFGIVFASTEISAQSRHLVSGSGTAISTMVR